MRLLLMRHAKSDRSEAGMRDHDRPLNARGRQAAPVIGQYLQTHKLVPDHVLVSTSVRTRETWALVAAALSRKPSVIFEGRLYEASPDAMLQVLRETPPQTGSLLVVAHNPGLQSLAIVLVGSGKIDARERMTEKFPTAALAVIDFPQGHWRELRANSGRLTHFVTPRGLTDAD